MFDRNDSVVLMKCIKLGAIAFALWIAPSLIPLYWFRQGEGGDSLFLHYVYSTINWICAILCFVFVVLTAMTAAAGVRSSQERDRSVNRAP